MPDYKYVEKLMQRFLDDGTPGAAISIARGNEILYNGYFGYADLAKTKPITPDTLYRVFSMTKPAAALCGMIQFERGAFLMDDPVSEYFPEFKHMQKQVRLPDGTWELQEVKNPILMKHLFSMSVGFIAHDGSPTDIAMQQLRRDLGGHKFTNKYDLIDETRALAKVPMLFEPAEDWQYGYGLDIMAAVVSLTSGMSLGKFMQENIFGPLGMEDTGYQFRPGWEERMAECVGIDSEGKVIKRTHSLGIEIDAGHMPGCTYEGAAMGLISSLGDYMKLTRMFTNMGTLDGVRVVGRKTLELMRQNLLNPAQLKKFQQRELQGFGYGYGVRTLLNLADSNVNSSVGEYGWAGAAGTWMSSDPSEGLSILFMRQVMNEEKYYPNMIRTVVNGSIE